MEAATSVKYVSDSSRNNRLNTRTAPWYISYNTQTVIVLPVVAVGVVVSVVGVDVREVLVGGICLETKARRIKKPTKRLGYSLKLVSDSNNNRKSTTTSSTTSSSSCYSRLMLLMSYNTYICNITRCQQKLVTLV
eukprot:GHVS01091148.1.p1 GENE.GHVS01091148.1~~GHVS01091148.1.p1  ORF type:complete len:135 (+),score=25.17 GHVS01091148.1:54-458(+)